MGVHLRLLFRRFALLRLLRFRRRAHSLRGALLRMQVRLVMCVAVLACRPVDDAFVRLDQREVVLRDEADLARQLVVDDSTCLDLCDDVMKKNMSVMQSASDEELATAATHPTRTLPLEHADQLARLEPHLRIELGLERVNSAVNARDKLAQLVAAVGVRGRVELGVVKRVAVGRVRVRVVVGEV